MPETIFERLTAVSTYSVKTVCMGRKVVDVKPLSGGKSNIISNFKLFFSLFQDKKEANLRVVGELRKRIADIAGQGKRNSTGCDLQVSCAVSRLRYLINISAATTFV